MDRPIIDAPVSVGRVTAVRIHVQLDEVGFPREATRLMAYMLLMMEPVGQRQARTEAEGRDAYASMVRWAEGLQKRGLLLATESLRSQASASRVQVRSGRPHITDGPFPETKEFPKRRK